MTGDLYINGKDAFTYWGVNLSERGLTALMTPPSLKERITNNSRLEHGKRMLNNAPRFDSREISLDIHLIAQNCTEFFTRYNSFCEELATGALVIRTKYQPTVYYHTLYVSCTQYTAIIDGLAKFTLKLQEPNPNNRTQ